MRSVVLLAFLSLLQLGVAKQGPHATGTVATAPGGGTGSNPSTKTTGTAGHHGPYEEIGSMIKEKAKKAKFFQLLKQLREVKNGDLPDAQKNATRKALNEDVRKLVGDDIYAQVQKIHRRQAQNLHTLKKDTVAPKKNAGVQAAAASPGAAPPKKGGAAGGAGGTAKKKKPSPA